MWFGIESGDFYLPGSGVVNQSQLNYAALFNELDGEDVPGLACDIRGEIVDALTERKKLAEQELSEL